MIKFVLIEVSFNSSPGVYGRVFRLTNFFLDIDKRIPLHLLGKFLDESPPESEEELDNFDDEQEEAQANIEYNNDDVDDIHSPL